MRRSKGSPLPPYEPDTGSINHLPNATGFLRVYRGDQLPRQSLYPFYTGFGFGFGLRFAVCGLRFLVLDWDRGPIRPILRRTLNLVFSSGFKPRVQAFGERVGPCPRLTQPTTTTSKLQTTRAEQSVGLRNSHGVRHPPTDPARSSTRPKAFGNNARWQRSPHSDRGLRSALRVRPQSLLSLIHI